MKRIILIGGAGLIGSSIYDYLESNSNFDFDIIPIEKKRFNKKKSVICDISKKNLFKNKLQFLDKKYGQIDAIVNCSYPQISKKNVDPLNLNLNIFNQNYLIHLNSYLNVITESINYFKKKKN